MSHPMPSDEMCRAVSDAFQDSARDGIEREAKNYVRARDLHRLIAIMPDDDDEAIVYRLKHALNAYRVLGLRRHWSYEPSHHIALASALKAEQAALAHKKNVQGLVGILRAAE